MDPNIILLILAAVGAVHRLGLKIPLVSPFLDRIFGPNGTDPLIPKDGEKITGRPLLDMMVRAALKQYKGVPLVDQILIAFAQQVDKLLDDAGVPELPDLHLPVVNGKDGPNDP